MAYFVADRSVSLTPTGAPPRLSQSLLTYSLLQRICRPREFGTIPIPLAACTAFLVAYVLLSFCVALNDGPPSAIVLFSLAPFASVAHTSAKRGNPASGKVDSLPRERSAGSPKDDRKDILGVIPSEGTLNQLALLEFTLEAVPDEIFVKDCERRLVFANSVFLQERGVSLQDAIGKDTDSLLPPTMVELSRESDRAVLERGETINCEFVDADKLGNPKYVEIEKKPLLDNGRIIGVLGICRNRTEKVMAEKRLKDQENLLFHASRLSTIGELVAGIAHEVNQPLYSITNYAKALKISLAKTPASATPEVMHCVTQIVQAAERGGQISNRLRDFVQHNEPTREKVECYELLDQSVSFVNEESKLAGVSILCKLNEDAGPRVFVDRVQIQQVMVNLLKNAIEAFALSDVAFPQIELTVEETESGIEISVSDNGPGISDGNTEDVFDAFFTTKKDGFGLGLPISNTILRAHDSVLRYEASPQGGARFSFVLT